MRFLVTEKLGPHKFKTPEGYLICTDAILSRTGKQEYKRCELFGDACDDPDKIVNVERTDDEVFSDKAMASFENKPVCIEHPDHDVNAENHNELAVGFVRDIHKGEDNGKPVMMGTLVITDKDAVEAVESGEYKELSCGYDCDIDDDGEPCQRNIRGNHVALCKQGRAGNARIVDSIIDDALYNSNFNLSLTHLPDEVLKEDFIELRDKLRKLTEKNWRYRVATYGDKFKIVLEKAVGAEMGKYGPVGGQWKEIKTIYTKDFQVNDAPFGEQIKVEHRKILIYNDTAKFNDLKREVEKLKNKNLSESQISVIKRRIEDILKAFKENYEADIKDVKAKKVNATIEEVKKHYEKVDKMIKNTGLTFTKIVDDAKSLDVNDSQFKAGEPTLYQGLKYTVIKKLSELEKQRLAYKLNPNVGDYYEIKSKSGMTTVVWEKKLEKLVNDYKGDIDMNDIKTTNKPGIDKIIYIMQSDIDENLYFYIGKTFSMKEGNWGYTKFEMNETTAEQLKADLTRNGWHQVQSGPAKVIDASNEEWTVVEEENYKKANKPIGANDADVYHGQHEIVVNGKKYKPYYVESGLRNIILQSYGTYFVMPYDIYSKYVDTGIDISKYIILQTKSKSEALKIGLNTKDSLDMSNKEQLFTIKYEQDGVMYIRKVRANSIEDAISKVKDDGHKVVIFTNQVLNEMGKNNSIGKYDRVVQAMRSLYSESLLPDNELKELIRKKVPEYIKKYVKE